MLSGFESGEYIVTDKVAEKAEKYIEQKNI